MASVFNSENMLAFAYLSAGSVTVVIVYIILRILLHRIEFIVAHRRRSRFEARWRPAFNGCMLDAENCTLDMIPALATKERFLFLTLYNYYQEELAGFASQRLRGMARRLRIAAYARILVGKAALRESLVATIFLGNIQDEESWPLLEQQLRHDNPLLSIQAARALAQIDLDRALPLIFAEHLRRDDWQGAQVVAVLRKEIRADILTSHLARILTACRQSEVEKLLPFMDYMHHDDRSSYLRFLITTCTSPPLLARLLRAIDSDENLELARQFVDHEHWYVRNQAVAALGRLGSRADLPLLVRRLGDEQWWVRYRAAKGLAHILQGRDVDLLAIRDTHQDRYARQMIDQVLAEGRFDHHESV